MRIIFIQVKRKFYDKDNVKAVFNVGEFVKVDDEKRAKTIMTMGLGAPTSQEPDSFKVLGEQKEVEPKETPKVKEAPKPRRRQAKK